MSRYAEFELGNRTNAIFEVNPRVSTLENMNKRGQSQPISGDYIPKGKKGKSSGKLKGKGGY
jgi:hypothetical protein